MNRSKFVYVIYIAAQPEQIWKGLVDPEFTRRYWEHDNVSDWKVGSSWEHARTDGSGRVDILGRVVETNPPHRLVISWAWPRDQANLDLHSRVTFEIDAVDTMPRLTVTHEDLEPDSDMLKGITNGWPRVLSSLKSLLETGRPLPTWAKG